MSRYNMIVKVKLLLVYTISGLTLCNFTLKVNESSSQSADEFYFQIYVLT